MSEAGGTSGWVGRLVSESWIPTQIQGSLSATHAGKVKKAAREIKVLSLPHSFFPVSQLLQDRGALGQSKRELGVFVVAGAVKRSWQCNLLGCCIGLRLDALVMVKPRWTKPQSRSVGIILAALRSSRPLWRTAVPAEISTAVLTRTETCLRGHRGGLTPFIQLSPTRAVFPCVSYSMLHL